MANITFLSWNIQKFGMEKINQSEKFVQVVAASGGRTPPAPVYAVFNFIAATIRLAGADVVAIMEFPKGKDRLQAQAGIRDALGTNWRSCFIEAGNEYCFFWNSTKVSVEGTGVDVSDKAVYDAGVDSLMAGVTGRKYDGTTLQFPTENSTLEAGRPGGYCFFREKTSGYIFCAVVFHAPGPGKRYSYTALGGYCLAQASVLRVPPMWDPSTKATDIPKVVIGGDFNVNWDDNKKEVEFVVSEEVSVSGGSASRPKTEIHRITEKHTPRDWAYGFLTGTTAPSSSSSSAAPPPTTGSLGMHPAITDEPTSLTSADQFSPSSSSSSAAPPPTTTTTTTTGPATNDFRVNSYDHIFTKGLGNKNGTVLDAIAESMPGGGLADAVKQYAGTAGFTGLPRWVKGDALTDSRDAFLFYRTLISDHLPVYVECEV